MAFEDECAGEVYDDTLVPMRSNLETARFNHEFKVKKKELWFETTRAVGCTKTYRVIKWNVSKHSPMVADVIIAQDETRANQDSRRLPLA